MLFTPYMRVNQYKLTRIRVNSNMSAENDQPITLMRVRQKANMTQKQWADLLGVTISTVSNWERGVQVPRLTFLQTKRIMETSGLSIDDLVSAFDNTHEKEQSAEDSDIPSATTPQGGDN
jgi:DNA-binding transcriptional regulator YiaG